jgi:aspartate kinase
MEIVIKNYFEKSNGLQSAIPEVKKYHNQILLDLFDIEDDDVFFAVNSLFADLEYFLRSNKSPNYNFVYDQVVSYGELISTTIISHYFNFRGLKNHWLDVREYIKTDSTYRDAEVNWEATQKNISKNVKKKALNITQGFIGSDENGFTTTLGR